jgi:signal transduction histidine kinase
LTTTPNLSDPGMELIDLLSDRQFLDRGTSASRAVDRFEAFQILSRVFVEEPKVVLQKLVDVAVEFCGADSAGISLEESDDPVNPHFRWIAISGSFSQYLHGTTPRFFSPCGTCLSSGRPQHYRVSKPYYDFLGVTAEPINDGLLIPWSSDESKGTIWAVSHGSRETFGPEDYRLLSTLADFVSISVRLTERQQRTETDFRALQRIQQVTTRLVGGHDFQSGLTEILSAASDLAGTDKGNIQIYDSEIRALRVIAHQGLGPRVLQQFSKQSSRLATHLTSQKIERVVWNDVAAEPALHETEDLAALIEDGIRSIQSTPLVSLDGRLLGLLNNFFSAPHKPATHEAGYLDLLARMAADFIERWQADESRKRSHDDLEVLVGQRTSSLRKLSTTLLQVQDQERRKIARELHDSIGQYLVALKMNLSQLQRGSSKMDPQIVTDSQELIEQCLTETRTISHLLHPPLLDESGLRSAAQWYVEGFSKRSGIEVHLQVDENLERLPQDIETALFRLLQESLTNVHRHSQSPKVDILIQIDRKEAQVTIRDYGRGFTAQQLQDVGKGNSRGVGLTGLRERMGALGGRFEVLAAEPGSVLKVTLPIPDQAQSSFET